MTFEEAAELPEGPISFLPRCISLENDNEKVDRAAVLGELKGGSHESMAESAASPQLDFYRHIEIVICVMMKG
ncbi:hypothetical protein CBR_g29328 [Chara braunii]|uniref:Uncharacterized protein n=1 Tax=Chara braunii TaxID=69332 RepID=A0A388JWH6_CHABU|nr:hypothetical protein CBR_g29328 [Chara braunii]|eukprot:GBG62128.1 hypothetical protein CBR_g29328 [Chara braunii]